MLMSQDTSQGQSRKDLYLALVFSLAIETFCIVLFLFAWMTSKGAPVYAIWREVEVIPTQLVGAETQTIIVIIPSNDSMTLEPSKKSSTPIFVDTLESPQVSITNTTLPNQTLPIQPPGKIVYTCFDGNFDQICIMNADGSGQRQLTQDNATSFYPSITPDGNLVLFSSNRDGNFEIYSLDLNSGIQLQLTNDIGNLYAAELSPKGKRIIFSNDTGGLQSLWVMRNDGRNPRAFIQTGGGDIDPTWSHDGNQIAFASQLSGITEQYIANADATDVRKLMKKSFEIGGRSSWSPNKQWIAVYDGESGNHNIFKIPVDGGEPEKLTQQGDNLAPSFSPDGKWIAFTSYRDGNNEIYILNLDALQVYRLTTNSKSDYQPRWGP